MTTVADLIALRAEWEATRPLNPHETAEYLRLRADIAARAGAPDAAILTAAADEADAFVRKDAPVEPK